MIEITTKYELAAAHRLWNPNWPAERNFEVFGPCANPGGHGHNYTLEVTLRQPTGPEGAPLADPDAAGRLIRAEILERFDHQNLSQLEEFRALVPTVENMAKVFWDRLAGRFGPAQLARIRVWETPRTYADYFGPGAGPLRFSETV